MKITFMAIYKNKAAFIQLMIFGLIVFVSTILFVGMGALLGNIIFDSSAVYAFSSGNYQTEGSMAYGRFMQSISQIGIFLIPSLIFGFLVSDNLFSYYNLNKNLKQIWVLISFALVFLSIPIIGYTYELNQKLSLPESLQNLEALMKQLEESAALLVENMVKVESFGLLMLNLLVMAVIPAVSEELFFRGGLMRIFSRFIPNIHLNILIIAFIFSFIHFQFYGFLPRFLLGILLGYVYVYTRSIWMPILIHFLNNALSTISYYLFAIGKIDINPDELGTNFNPLLILLNVGLIILIFRYMYKSKPKTVLWR